MLLLLIGAILLSGCSHETDDSDRLSTPTEAYRVETAVDYHFDDGERLKIDVCFPGIISELPFGEELNKMMKVDFPDMGKDLSHLWSTVDGYPYTGYKYDYVVSDINGICSVNILDTISSAPDNKILFEWVFSYYFDSNSGTILTREKYLGSLGISPDEIVEEYIQKYYPGEEVKINFDYLNFYFDQNGGICFVFNEMAKLN